MQLQRGHIYVAPPDCHLGVTANRARVWKGSKENRHRPSIDVLLRSAAVEHGPRSIGVILSGALDDGVSGMDTIVRAGGHALVQQPSEARHPYLPQNVVAAVAAAEAHPLEMLVKRIEDITNLPLRDVSNESTQTQRDRLEQEITTRMGTREDMARLGPLSGLTCPECSGVLTEVSASVPLRYRCHTGHGYTASTLLDEQNEQAESLLWQAIRLLRENADLARRLSEQAQSHRAQEQAGHFQAHADEVEDRIGQLHRLVASRPENATNTGL